MEIFELLCSLLCLLEATDTNNRNMVSTTETTFPQPSENKRAKSNNFKGMLFKAAQIPSLAVVYSLTVLVLCSNILRAAVMRFLNGFIKVPFSRRYKQSRVKLRKLLQTSCRKCFHKLVALSSKFFHHFWGKSELSWLLLLSKHIFLQMRSSCLTGNTFGSWGRFGYK